jgi:hypothetical protein
VTEQMPNPQDGDGPQDPADNEAEEAVELFAGEGPIEHPGEVEDEDDLGTESPASDADAPSP